MESANLYSKSKEELITMIQNLKSEKENNNVQNAYWNFLPEVDPSIKEYWWECSDCGKKVGQGLDVLKPTLYCPRCGARMSDIID